MSARRKARSFAVQAIYQWQFNPLSPEKIIQYFMDSHDAARSDFTYFKELVLGVLAHREEIDQKMQPCLDRAQQDLNPVELAVLRLAIFEFLYRLDVPYKVVINEALEITKRYGSQDGYRYVNAVLDALALQLRAVEVKAAQPTRHL